jgi:hypothetical protein
MPIEIWNKTKLMSIRNNVNVGSHVSLLWCFKQSLGSSRWY